MEATDKPYRLGAIAYIYNPATKSLLLVQLNSYKEDEWNMPGGGREPGETAEQNVIREIREELDLTQPDYIIKAQAPEPLTYDFPPEFMHSNHPRAAMYRGQMKDRFLLYSSIDISEIHVNTDELRDAFWCPVDRLAEYLKFPHQLQDTIGALQQFDVL